MPTRKVTTNNRVGPVFLGGRNPLNATIPQRALQVLREQLAITPTPFVEHLTLTTREDHDEVDAGDDLTRELAL